MQSESRNAPDLPLVSVLIVTLDRWDLLRQCLASISAQDYPRLEVIVVDNGSTENIRGWLRAEFPSVGIVRLKSNAGFAGGNNAGLKVARGKHVALINNDAVADPAWVRQLVETAESDVRIGAVASVVLDGNEPGRLDSYGVGIALDGMSRQALRGANVEAARERREVLAASGCACLFRMEALLEAGFFDERFFAYCEDTDLCLRLRWAGWTVVAAPGAKVTHCYSKTGGAYSLRKAFWVERNRFWVALKNFPVRLLVLVPFATLWRHLVAASGCLRGGSAVSPFIEQSGAFAVIRTLLKAHFSALGGAGAMLRARFASRAVRRVSGGAMARTLLRFRMPEREALGERASRDP